LEEATTPTVVTTVMEATVAEVAAMVAAVAATAVVVAAMEEEVASVGDHAVATAGIGGTLQRRTTATTTIALATLLQ
jgi:hypothetical protein